MNNKMIAYILGWVLIFEAALMAPALIVSLIYREQAGVSILISIGLCLAAGFLLRWKKPEDTSIYSRDGFVAVALSWVVISLFGAVPFTISGYIPFYIDALFETISGFTTTGSSILTSVEALPKCLLFWRSFTHWVGGMGVLVFLMAIVPLAGGTNMYMMKAESPGPVVGKLVPKVKATAGLLYKMYLGLSILELLFLLAGRMPVFDSVCTVFGTAGTGGFGILNDSFASYSPYLQVVVALFMIAFGVNFSFYYLMVQKKPKAAFGMSEVRLYLIVIVTAITLITVNICTAGIYGVPEGIRQSLFQVGSIITTTGFASADFNLWPSFSKTILVLLMFMGACAGSTGGGMKVSRFIIWGKTVKKELYSLIHPHSVMKLKVDGKLVEHATLRSANVYLVTYFLIFAASLLLISLDNFDFTTNFTAVAATINNIGPGLEVVGPTGNFSQYSAFSKLVLSFDMLVGRLELFPLLVLFMRSTWKD